MYAEQECKHVTPVFITQFKSVGFEVKRVLLHVVILYLMLNLILNLIKSYYGYREYYA
jgi:hypothetical protein